MFDNLFSKEILILLITQFASYVALKKQHKNQIDNLRIQNKNEVEKYKMEFENRLNIEAYSEKRAMELKLLNSVYKPIIFVYKKADEELEEGFMRNNTDGSGLSSFELNEVDKIINDNMSILTLESILKYNDEYASYQMSFTAIEMINSDVKIDVDYERLFDNKYSFRNWIVKDAQRIESKYIL